MKNIWDLGFRDKPDVLAWEKEMMGERIVRYPIEGLATDFDMFNTWFDGLDIDKSTKPLTICQTIKYYQTRIWRYMAYRVYGYMGYRGYKGLSKYRRISPISNTETLNVSHNETGGV